MAHLKASQVKVGDWVGFTSKWESTSNVIIGQVYAVSATKWWARTVNWMSSKPCSREYAWWGPDPNSWSDEWLIGKPEVDDAQEG